MTLQESRLARLEAQLARLERERQKYWSVPIVGGAGSTPSYLWTVQGGNTILSSGRTGIALRSPNTAISPSELPDGAPGTGVIIVPAWPIPMGLPNGIGVIARTNASGGITYAFMRIDPPNPYGVQPLSAGEEVFVGLVTNLDKVSGATTWRYVCYSGPTGYY